MSAPLYKLPNPVLYESQSRGTRARVRAAAAEAGEKGREDDERAHFMQSDKFRKILSSPINHAHSSALLRPIPQIWREEF